MTATKSSIFLRIPGIGADIYRIAALALDSGEPLKWNLPPEPAPGRLGRASCGSQFAPIFFTPN
jgi:hypothetical protein